MNRRRQLLKAVALWLRYAKKQDWYAEVALTVYGKGVL